MNQDSRPLSQEQLAAYFALMEVSSLLQYAAGLLDRAGLITRHPTEDDERGVTVTITDAGRDMVASVLPGHVEVVRAMLFDAVSRRDLATLTTVLTRVRDHMRSTPAVVSV